MKLRRICNANYAIGWLIPSRLLAALSPYDAIYCSLFCGMFSLTAGSGVRV